MAKKKAAKKTSKKQPAKQGRKPTRKQQPSKASPADPSRGDRQRGSDADQYEKQKSQAAEASRRRSTAGRDIGPIPDVVDPKRKAKAKRSFTYCCEAYFPDACYLKWSKSHLRVNKRGEQVVRKGGKFAIAMPRGSGKTTIAVLLCLWALLFGLRRFVALICISGNKAEELLEGIRTELECNERLREDFPEVCYPIERLEQIHNRCKGQTCEGEPTRIGFTKKQIILPTVKGSAASGGIIRVAGLTSGFRGMQHVRTDGTRARPDLCLIDDPQDDESAASLNECVKNERIINGAIKGLAGPGKKIAALMPCTVIRHGDVAHRFLDHKTHPEWRGETTAMLASLPSNDKLWGEYAELLYEDQLTGGGRAMRLYRENREAMDAGADHYWPERFNEDEDSAIQNAMNLKIEDEYSFFAEYQNAPLDEHPKPEGMLSAAEIAERLNGLPRGRVMVDASHLVAFADIQHKAFYWVVCAFADDFTGQIVDDGVWPEQNASYFTVRQIKKTLARRFPGQGFEGRIYSGMEALTDELLGRQFRKDDGSTMEIDVLAYDANDGKVTDIVKRFCRQSRHRQRLKAVHGRAYPASGNPINSAARKAGERRGDHWSEPPLLRGQPVRHVNFDANYYKTFMHARLSTAIGDRGSLTLFGDKPSAHRMLCDHLVSEQPTTITNEKTGRKVDQYSLVKVGGENHKLDGVVGCLMLGSYRGCDLLPGSAGSRPPGGRRRKLSEIRKQKKGAA